MPSLARRLIKTENSRPGQNSTTKWRRTSPAFKNVKNISETSSHSSSRRYSCWSFENVFLNTDRQRKEDLYIYNICCWLLGWSDSVDLSLHAVRGRPVPPRGEGQPHAGGRAGRQLSEEGQPPPLEHHRWEPSMQISQNSIYTYECSTNLLNYFPRISYKTQRNFFF